MYTDAPKGWRTTLQEVLNWLIGAVSTVIVVGLMPHLTYVSLTTRSTAIAGFAVGFSCTRPAMLVSSWSICGALVGFLVGFIADLFTGTYPLKSENSHVAPFDVVVLSISLGRIAVEAAMASAVITATARLAGKWFGRSPYTDQQPALLVLIVVFGTLAILFMELRA